MQKVIVAQLARRCEAIDEGQAILGAGSTKASSELAALTRHAQVDLDPRYGQWSGARGVGISPPATPPATDLLAQTP